MQCLPSMQCSKIALLNIAKGLYLTGNINMQLLLVHCCGACPSVCIVNSTIHTPPILHILNAIDISLDLKQAASANVGC